MIKPDGVQRNLVSTIINRFEQRGYKLVAMKLMRADAELLNNHYSELKEKPFFPDLIAQISSGPVVPMVWEGKDIVNQGRAMIGATDPLSSSPGTIRGDFSIDKGRNIIHGSDSSSSAEKEIRIWFKENEVLDWEHQLSPSLYE